MIDLRFKPLPKWVDATPRNPFKFRPQFRTKYPKTLDLLESELSKLRAREIIVEAGFDLSMIRNDGWPYSSARPKHAGIVLYFQTGGGRADSVRPVRMPSATYTTFEANMHAVALTLEALRAIDRYGVTQGNQQYIGFMLPAPSEGSLTIEEAAGVVARIGKGFYGDVAIITSFSAYREAYRAAVLHAHPDQHDGQENEWLLLQTAKRILDLHHGQAAAK